MSDLVIARISRSALRHNLELLMAQARPASVCAVVKANAYGHGLSAVARALAGRKIAGWGVATADEAAALQKEAVRTPVLVFRPLDTYAPAKSLRAVVDWMLEREVRATIVSRAGLDLLAAGAARRKKYAWAHIKADTGMARNGCPAEEAVALISRALATPGIRVEGLYSHFAGADERNLDSARQQLAVFRSLVDELRRRGVRLPFYHLANSAAVFNLPAARLDLIRPGLALYGYGGEFIRGSRRLRPALRVEAPVVFARWIGKGQACGYGATFVARRKTRLGLLPIGYADGYARRWSNTGQVDFDGRPAPVIGRVSMDLTAVDLTDLRGVDVGSLACVISNRRSDPHSVESMARQLGAIPYEITTALGNRIRRVLAP